MIVALARGALLALAFVAFLANLIWTLGWSNILGLVLPDRHREREPARA